MKQAIENILKATSVLSDKNREFIIRQLKTINNKITSLAAENDSYKRQLTGVTPVQYNETLQKTIDVLKLLGFNEFEFVGLSPDFLNWLIEQTIIIKKYNPKLMNFYLLTSMQQAYFLTYAELQGETPTYIQVRKTMLSFDSVIESYENELKLSLPELIFKIDGKD